MSIILKVTSLLPDHNMKRYFQFQNDGNSCLALTTVCCTSLFDVNVPGHAGSRTNLCPVSVVVLYRLKCFPGMKSLHLHSCDVK